MTELGELLREIREEEGEYISDMAKRLNISCEDIYAINRGKRELSKNEINNVVKKYELEGEHLYLLKNITHKDKLFDIACNECGSKNVAIGMFDVANDIIEFRCRNCNMIDVVSVDFY
ncbi:TPA: hypothetical protein KRE09_004200 [Clostridioides difficile]|uniref:hypothetical protein n=1 Tax=Clostridioides difficile TaxID=1496 RepID=UPI00038CE169|nr:hypothetical protein [Clostridioides difficile]QVW56643.1 hypothetical protein [Clostridioides phage CD1801]CCL66900.1 hypothetical protein BN183_3560002 [Clostridioides difficile E7]EGT3686448.1 hypothetical protein [Clostridioides difficile]EGT3750535.1 hypothetical protein [Clostridioides difficile]EGT4542127.1 hypothetical protein [Clostridioides difficile]